MAIPIVYIVGPAHSGSTILGLLLGAHSRLVNAGEVHMLSPRRAHFTPTPARDWRCACGAPSLRECGFWTRVSRRVERETGSPMWRLDLDHRHPGHFGVIGRAFFGAVLEETGADYVIDNSKDWRRLRRLARDPAFDLRAIQLVRHPCGVVHSHVRRGRSWLVHTRRYSTNLVLGRWIVSRHPHRVVRYEALAARPTGTLGGILDWLGLSLEPSQLEWARKPFHTIGGNPTRHQPERPIEVDDAWRHELSRWRRALITTVTAPLLAIPPSAYRWLPRIG